MKVLYRNLWASRDARTLILSSLILTMCVLFELSFLFFPDILENTIFQFIMVEIILFEGSFQPLLVLLHLAIWGIMFFSTLLVYTSVKEYSGRRTGLLEIGAILIAFLVTSILIYDQWFTLFLLCLNGFILLYLYILMQNE